MRHSQLLSGEGNTVGCLVLGELRLKLVVGGAEASLFLLQARDLVAGLSRRCRLRNEEKRAGNKRRSPDERRDRKPAATPARARRG